MDDYDYRCYFGMYPDSGIRRILTGIARLTNAIFGVLAFAVLGVFILIAVLWDLFDGRYSGSGFAKYR